LLHFADKTLDLIRGGLTVGGRQVDLRPKSFAVLRYLLENPGRLISKDELVAIVWPDLSVTDESLTQCISEVRKAINDVDQAVIKTVPRRGYILSCVVTSEIEPSGGSGERAQANLDKPSVAVTAFVNLSGDSSQDYFSDGITEDIITELSRSSDLLVISRNSTFRYKGRSVDVRQIGHELQVAYVVEGSVRRAGDRVRITTQLVDATTGTHRWADRYDHALHDVFVVQDEVVRTIVSILTAHVGKAEGERSLRKPRTTWRAYDYYLQGAETYAAFHRAMSADKVYAARNLLERSLAIDPSFASAHAALSATYTTTYNLPFDSDHLNPGALQKAQHHAFTAVQLDPNLPKAHAQLAYVYIYLRQPDLAVGEFDRSVALNPNFSDWRLPLALMMAGDPAKAVDVARSHLRLDPFSLPIARGYLGLAHYMLKDYEVALPILREFVAVAPNHPPGHLWLASTYAQLGLLPQAQSEAAEVLRIDPTWTIRKFEPLGPFKRPVDAKHFFDGMRKAGLPEG
jgi:adenylate cyclase